MILKVSNLSKSFSSGFWDTKKFNAVNNVSFEIKKGESFGLIGESGSGKSTITKMLLRLLKPTSGEVIFDGKDILKLKSEQMRLLRKDLQVIFQYPQQAFNPKEKIIKAIREPIEIFNLAKNKNEEDILVDKMINSVGLTKDQLQRYPHEISGGQAQRLAISRALILNPKLLIADELTSMLDVSVQAQILSLLKEEREKRNLSLLFISHDLDVIYEMCDRVGVMKNGKLVEVGHTNEVFNNPQNEYTKLLIKSRIFI